MVSLFKKVKVNNIQRFSIVNDCVCRGGGGVFVSFTRNRLRMNSEESRLNFY